MKRLWIWLTREGTGEIRGGALGVLCIRVLYIRVLYIGSAIYCEHYIL